MITKEKCRFVDDVRDQKVELRSSAELITELQKT